MFILYINAMKNKWEKITRINKKYILTWKNKIYFLQQNTLVKPHQTNDATIQLLRLFFFCFCLKCFIKHVVKKQMLFEFCLLNKNFSCQKFST